MSTDDGLHALPLDGPLGHAMRFALLSAKTEIEAFSRGELGCDTLVIDVNGEAHFCDLCGQLYAEPLSSLEMPFVLGEDDPLNGPRGARGVRHLQGRPDRSGRGGGA